MVKTISDINVIIPSYKRASDLVGKDYFYMAKYCIPESQADDYREYLKDNRIIIIPDDNDGSITKKRNWILENIPRPLIMIDDDVKYLRYVDNKKLSYIGSKLPKTFLADVLIEMVNMAEQFGVKMFGVSQKKR